MSTKLALQRHLSVHNANWLCCSTVLHMASGVPHPGVSEQGWLADLKQIAEAIGCEVYGEAIKWEVEALPKSTSKRPDLVIRRDATGEALASGEAKRPDVPEGIHPLVAGEVDGALFKAQKLGVPVFFTTNFFECAVFDARNKAYLSNLDRIQGAPIPLVSPALAKAPEWWAILPSDDRRNCVELGIRQLFERLKVAAAQTVPRDINEVAMLVFGRTTERLVGPLWQVLLQKRNAAAAPPELAAQAARAQLHIGDDAQARYLIAQGVAEILTAALFHRNIADHFSLRPLLAGTDPRTLKALSERITTSLQQTIHTSGDYETIFRLSDAAQWALRNGGHPILQHWKGLFQFIDQLDFTSVSSEVIGSIFERLISPERRHEMGQHYTDARIARPMSCWAVVSANATMADISCGAGTFLVEGYARFSRFGLDHSEILKRVIGNDIDPFAVHLASVNLATRDIHRGANYPAIRLGDAFDLKAGITIIAVDPSDGPRFSVAWPDGGLDAIVGNPPYAEAPENETILSQKLQQIGATIPSKMKGGNLAAWFALLGSALLKPGGRLAFVMPTGVLQNENLGTWRTWLRQTHDLVVWHTEADVWFSDARVAVCVLLATRHDRPPAAGSLKFVDVHERIGGELFSDDQGTPIPSRSATVRDLSSLATDADILVAGTYPAPLRQFLERPAVTMLREMQNVSVFSGNKLGHPCFQLRDAAPDAKGVLRHVKGFQLSFTLNSEYLLPLLSSPKDERTGEFQSSQFWVLNAPKRVPAKGQLRAYIKHCESLGVHRAPSVQQRGKEWWHVLWRKAQIAVQIHPGFLHQVWWSRKPFIAKNNFHVLDFDAGVSQRDRELVGASLASAFGALSALYVSSEVGCEGVRWVRTEQFQQWPTLNPAHVGSAKTTAVLDAYRKFRRLESTEIHAMDASAIESWTALTTAVAAAAGLNNPQAAACVAIECARQTCLRRTQRETLALSGRIRGMRRGASLSKRLQEQLSAHADMASILERLTSGNRMIKTRSSAQRVQGAFDFIAIDPSEQALAGILGEGFECSPIVGGGEQLASDIRAMLLQLSHGLTGASDTASFADQSEIPQEISEVVVAWLQREVKRRLQ